MLYDAPVLWFWWRSLDDARMVDVKIGVALVGAGVLLWIFLADRTRRLRPGRRARELLLATLGMLACACWWNLGRFHFDSFIHYYEFYHYYLGAKYAPELGYTRLYECTVAAEDEYAHLGAALERMTIRDLTTNTLITTSDALAHPERCRQHFSPERWREFEGDSDFFRRASSWGFWSSALLDNGYNATPVWRLAAGLLANLGAIDQAMLFDLALLDPILLATMAFVIGWAFGWRTLCLALLFFGTNYPGRYFFTGGAFLRMDWLLATIASICFMKKGRPFAAGVAIAVATLLRVFPGFVVVALLIKVALESLRARRLCITPAHKRFVVGGMVAVALLVPLSSVYGGGFQCWRGFVENSKKHVSTPLTNNMGLKSVVAYSLSTRAALVRDGRAFEPFAPWKRDQQRNFRQRLPLYVLALFGFVVLLGRAVVRHDDWVAMVLGVGLILFAAQLTSYYFICFIAFALLWPYVSWIGFALLLMSAASCIVPNFLLGWADDHYVVISLIYMLFVVAVTVWLGWFSSAAPAPSPKTHGRDRRSNRRRAAAPESTRSGPA